MAKNSKAKIMHEDQFYAKRSEIHINATKTLTPLSFILLQFPLYSYYIKYIVNR